MLGMGKRADDNELPVFVHAIQNNEAFAAAQRLWNENARLLYVDRGNNKEFVRFSYAKPACNAWLQRDQGRTDEFELVLLWKGGERSTEVYVLMPQTGQTPQGDPQRLTDILNAMLTTPSIVPAGS